MIKSYLYTFSLKQLLVGRHGYPKVVYIIFIYILCTCVGSHLVSCGYDMQVNVWDMNTYQLKNSYKVEHKQYIIFIILLYTL